MRETRLRTSPGTRALLPVTVGILAHAWEQMGQGGRNKGPTPATPSLDL